MTSAAAATVTASGKATHDKCRDGEGERKSGKEKRETNTTAMLLLRTPSDSPTDNSLYKGDDGNRQGEVGKERGRGGTEKQDT